MSGPSDDKLPPHLRQRPARPGDWPLPTAWLLGTKLLGSMRDIILSSIVKVDLRTWMTAGDVVDRTSEKHIEDGEECCYIDFLADTGDSQRLVYQLARLLKQDRLEVKSWQKGVERTRVLPRGSLLILGGDIAYPVATHRRLLDRIRAPFKWAHDELAPAVKEELERKPVTLLAVPGNHDYYDGLRGFEAMFHAPPVHPFGPASADRAPSQKPLHLPGYQLAQHASYFAAALPFEWQVWGLDIESHAIDERQAAYFEWAKTWRPGAGAQQETRNDSTPGPAPERLIVVTSRPSFVYQGPSDHAKVIKTSMERLNLTPAFARHGKLESHRVRLDLSGDVHLYERYWGTDGRVMPDDLDDIQAVPKRDRNPRMAAYEPPERYAHDNSGKERRRRGNDDKSRDPAPLGANYASVVSGLGGTFHHPGQVRMGTTPARASWPSAEHSAREIGIRLADPLQMFRAGAVGIVGLAVALACYFLVWESATTFNVLDIPFALATSLSDAHTDALCELGRVAGMVGIVGAMIGLPIGAYFVGRWLSTPIREMRQPTGWWQRLTKALTHNAAVTRILRLFGANVRSTWMFLTNVPPLLVTAAGWWKLSVWLRELNHQIDSSKLVAVYTIITVLVAALAALGFFRAGEKSPLEGWTTNIVRRVLFLVFGIVVALLVLWTPYAWVRLICRNHLFGGLGLAIIALTMVVQLGRFVFPRPLWARRLMTMIGFLLLVAGALGFPLCFAGMDGSPVTNAQPAVSLLVAASLGAYFACLWVGWYFCICLQWNAHGNEAGSAARITDYGEFLRIKLTKNRAEVWTIAVEEALDPRPRWFVRLFGRKTTLVEPQPTARLIDHFSVERT